MPHAALRGVHRLGDAEPERPEMAAEGDGGVPVDRGVEPRIAVGERIGDDMRRRIGDAVERRLGRREILRRLRRVGRELPPAAGRLSVGMSSLVVAGSPVMRAAGMRSNATDRTSPIRTR